VSSKISGKLRKLHGNFAAKGLPILTFSVFESKAAIKKGAPKKSKHLSSVSDVSVSYLLASAAWAAAKRAIGTRNGEHDT